MKDAARRLYERLLVFRCQAGEEAALEELIARYSPGLRFYLRKMIGRDAADDLLQDVWFDAYRKINALKDPDACGAWLYRIARDKVYRELRRRPLPLVSMDGDVPERADEEQETFTAQDAQRIRAALDHLPADQREILLLRFIEQMGYEQIAQVISRPLGTVRSRIHYAKAALRARLESQTTTERQS